MGTGSNLDGNTVGTDPQKNPNPLHFPPPQNPKEKNLSPIECMLSIHIGCMKLLIVSHHLQLGLYPHFIVLLPLLKVEEPIKVKTKLEPNL
jgi:hypothetical protein